MKLSLFSAALILLAAGSEATPLAKPGSPGRHHRSKRQDTCVVRSTNKTINVVPQGNTAAGAGSTTPHKMAQSVAGAGSTTLGTDSSNSGTGSTTPGTGSTSPGTDSSKSGTGSTSPGTDSSNSTTGSTTPDTGSTTPQKMAQSVAGTDSTTQGTGRKLAEVADGAGSTSSGTDSSTPSTGSTTPGTGSTTLGNNSTTTTTPGGNGTASSLDAQAQPATGGTGGFCNTVFNTGAPKNSGWPNTWSTLTSNGVHDWIGFALKPLSETGTYNTGAGAATTTTDLNTHQMHVVMDGRNVNDAVTLLKTNPPAYLELFNEPDYSFQGFTPLTDPVSAANDLAPLFTMPHPQTTYISPALADATSQWLAQFFAACNNCIDQIPIIALHMYSPDVQTVMDKINALHTYPGFSSKDIWITELSPASENCTLDSAGVIDWMTTLTGRIQKETPYVKKIFWNCGEHGGGADGLAGGSCNPSLTNDDGSATPLLNAYGTACGGGS